MRIEEVQRKLIRKCPPELLGSELPFAKVHLSQIKANKHFRSPDICNELSKVILNVDLFAKFVGVRNDGMPDIKLYSSHHSKHCIYEQLIGKKFYQKIK